ncbi:ATP-dependent RNA helicase ddx54 [Phlyctochytrium planicorne]|nr:ATP-dependent RNA helicase ddx54 [Phlyctochytrium planicorne]
MSDSDDERNDGGFGKMNRKKGSGGFQSMGLSHPVYTAITQRGYKNPTPIQRKAIPIILEKRDVVAMARTGSGKTAAFLIPMIERLKTHSAKFGARGLILSPSRELAFQTLKFFKELAKNTDLRTCVLVGGDTLDDQFSTIAMNPDVLIATPGRLMHLIIEMNLDLRLIEYVVFDEADRLFELGFAEQLREILHKLPEDRQTLLFSATLPKLLVDFAKAGLADPALIRLDVDTKLSPDLELFFFNLKAEEKDAALLYMLNTVIPRTEQTIIFVATKHLVEYVHELLNLAGVSSTYVYGSLDQVARNMHIAQFRAGEVKILIVTDIAARGLDIPMLDNVINYDFPASSKVMVHRAGRVARAGRRGRAFSLLTSDELPFLLDFQLFLGRPLVYGTVYENTNLVPNYTKEIIVGTLAPASVDLERENVLQWLKNNATLTALAQSVKNSYKLYNKTRGTASRESYTRAKDISNSHIGIHPYLGTFVMKKELERASVLEQLSNFRPSETIFEVGRRGLKSSEAQLMQVRRQQFAGKIAAQKDKRVKDKEKILEYRPTDNKTDELPDYLFSSVITDVDQVSKKRKRESTSKDPEFYIAYEKKDSATERGYSVNATEQRSSGVDSLAERGAELVVDLNGDDEDSLRRKKGNLTWDKRKKKFVRETVGADNKKRIKTDSGASIPASFKSNKFEMWQKKTRVELPRSGEEELKSLPAAVESSVLGIRKYRHNKITAADPKSANFKRKQAAMERAIRKGEKLPEKKTPQGNAQAQAKGVKSELRSSEQIAKMRRQKEQRRLKTGRHGPGHGKKGGSSSSGKKGGSSASSKKGGSSSFGKKGSFGAKTSSFRKKR